MFFENGNGSAFEIGRSQDRCLPHWPNRVFHINAKLLKLASKVFYSSNTIQISLSEMIYNYLRV